MLVSCRWSICVSCKPSYLTIIAYCTMHMSTSTHTQTNIHFISAFRGMSSTTKTKKNANQFKEQWNALSVRLHSADVASFASIFSSVIAFLGTHYVFVVFFSCPFFFLTRMRYNHWANGMGNSHIKSVFRMHMMKRKGRKRNTNFHLKCAVTIHFEIPSCAVLSNANSFSNFSNIA